MDFFGFLDGLFSAFSAMRSGRNTDDSETKENNGSEQHKLQSTTNTYDESIKSRQAQINSSRVSINTNKEPQNDRDRS
jgi:hypothetical protein